MTKNTHTALIGFALFLPGVFIFALLVLGIEPNFGPLAPRGANSPHLMESLLVLFLVVVMPAIALALNVGPLASARRAGQALLANPVNLAVCVISFGIISAFFGAIIVDQYPCWMGVPNCD